MQIYTIPTINPHTRQYDLRQYTYEQDARTGYPILTPVSDSACGTCNPLSTDPDTFSLSNPSLSDLDSSLEQPSSRGTHPVLSMMAKIAIAVGALGAVLFVARPALFQQVLEYMTSMASNSFARITDLLSGARTMLGDMTKRLLPATA
jgi:hypothetical protein